LKPSLGSPRPAVFLDRDGTINEERGHIHSPEGLVLLPGATTAIRRLNESQYLTVIVTNQSVIARGKCTETGMKAIHNRLEFLMKADGAFVDGIYYCPHHPDREIPGGRKDLKIVCDCRKPEPGLIKRAAKDMNIDLNLSWMIGDMTRDIEAANRAGIRSVLLAKQGSLDNQYSVSPVAECLDLKNAVKLILNYSID